MPAKGFIRNFKALEILTEEQMESIHRGSLDVLEHTGVRFESEKAVRRPGPTYALIVSKKLVVGVDSEGYVTCRESSFSGDLPVITGFAVSCDSIGEEFKKKSF